MPDTNDPIIKQLITALANEEEAIAASDEALARARAVHDIAARKYAAVRDMVTERLGYSSYSPQAQGYWQTNSASHGKYRYMQMKTGDAVVEFLRDSDEPWDLDEIRTALIAGGLGGIGSTPRGINAAVTNNSSIEKTKDGKYLYRPQPDGDDPPI